LTDPLTSFADNIYAKFCRQVLAAPVFAFYADRPLLFTKNIIISPNKQTGETNNNIYAPEYGNNAWDIAWKRPPPRPD
jgi:hypothetical protein